MTRSGLPPRSTPLPRLIALTRFPAPGRVKTRLASELGPERAAQLHAELAVYCLERMRVAACAGDVELEIRIDGASPRSARRWLGSLYRTRAQGDGDLGDRLSRCIRSAFAEGAPAAVAVGSDCPALGGSHVRSAITALRSAPVVLGPATDGGYYLVAVRADEGVAATRALFGDGIPWGGPDVLATTRARLDSAGIGHSLLEGLSDVDRPEDVIEWEHRKSADEDARVSGRISAVIPTLEESDIIADAITAALRAGVEEVIVADASSRDSTAQRAENAGALVIDSPRGRGVQMNRGAERATGDVLVFVHADTLLPPTAGSDIRSVLRDPRVVGGGFRYAAGDAHSPRDRLISATGILRDSVFRLPYGDQAQFVLRRVFGDLGGFPEIPTMEDYEFALRLRAAGRVDRTPTSATSSTRAWDERGLIAATATNMLVIGGYRLGVPVDTLAGWRRRAARRAR